MHILLRDDSRVEFFPLSHNRQGEEWIVVGRKGTSDYLDVSPVGFQIISLLEKGKTVSQVEKTIREKLGESYDVKSFVAKLEDNRLVRAVDGKILERREKKDFINLGAKLALSKEKVSFLFSKPALLIYAIILVEGILLIAGDFNSFVSYKDFVFTESLSIFLLVSFATSWVLVALHETGHYVAGLHFGAKPRFGLIARLQYLIAFTELTDLYLVKKWKRNVVFLAGLVVDGLILAMAVGLVWAGNYGIWAVPLWLIKFLKFVILVEVFGIVWQTMVFLRTDLYYLLENLFGIESLHEESLRNIRFVWTHLYGGRPLHSVFKTEIKKRYIIFYNLFLAFGVIANLVLLLFYEVPITIFLISTSVLNVSLALAASNVLGALDSLVFLAVFFFNFGLLFFAFSRAHALTPRTIKHWSVYARGLLYPLYALPWKHHVQHFMGEEKKFKIKPKQPKEAFSKR
ncbi:MAG: hypothetical protein V1717_04450 [Candidatus Micrarchaeota archaeon]